ncbi:MAG TPA: DNA mismatch repair protein MutS, partial [Thermotogota bacterium]|nr:DNA mismatch repair protein MutS [Thermotogota bacterium]
TFLEKRAYLQLMERLKPFIPEIQTLSERVSVLDLALSFAFCAQKRGFKRPSFSPERQLAIRQGRHPVIEQNQDFFIPNDLHLDKDHRFIILTGPNMAGKSTYLRQAAVITVMAQIGSFVPAESAELPIFDRIFTRIGARDDLSSGKSTFLVEMTETAAILNNATDRSLIILDEIGRGTSTYDGISIAWVVSEYILNAIGAYCIFATHYNELTELGALYPGIHNFRIKVTEENGEVLFLYKVEEGAADRSYGIEVARIAGLPPEVITRANQVLETITTENRLESKVRVLGSTELEKMKQKLLRSKRINRYQMTFFDKADFEV